MEKEKLSIGENKLDSNNGENILGSLGTRRRILSIFDSQKENAEDGKKKMPKDEKTPELLSICSKEFSNPNGLEIKLTTLDKKRSKQVKTKTCSGIEKEPSSHPITNFLVRKSADLASLEGLQDMESDRKVHESLDTFIRQTMGREPYMSFSSRPGENPLQKIIEHQQAMNKCVKSLKVDIDIRDGLEDNTNVEPHQVDIERDPFGTKGGSSLGRGLQADRNLQTIKSSVPQAVAAFVATKNSVQLQKCEKCSREFFSPFNHRRHTRIHRRISHVDKEDLTLKRKNVAAFWDKLNQDEAQQIFVSSKKYNLEDLSGETVVSHLLALKSQNNPMTLPSAYLKAGQDLLDLVDNKQIVFPLFSEQILSILDEASEKTFLCSQGDVSKIVLEEKNLVAFLGFIVEQTLVKAWMADKDAEALRNQQELVKEEEAAQMKRERIVVKKKKKKEKFRQKVLKERKGGATLLALNEDNESIDGKNPSSEIAEEDNSPTASSTSINSFGLENPLLEHLEMEVNYHVQNADGRVHSTDGNGEHLLKSKDILSTHVTESIDEQVQHSECSLAFPDKEGEQCSDFPSSSQVMMEDQGGCHGCILEQDQSVVESRKRTLLKPFREPIKVDYQDLYQRGSWILDPKFQEGIQQNSYRALRKPVIGTLYTSNIELVNNFVPGFYRGKYASLRGTTTFPATQQWAKKAQAPIVTDHVNKNGHEDESSHEHDTFTSKNYAKDVAIKHIVVTREMDFDTVGIINRAENEEFKMFEKKEPLPVVVPSVAKVVVDTGSLSNTPSASFNLNVNLEDWPPLSNSHAAQYTKSVGMYSLTSSQCEVNSRPLNNVNIDRGDGHQVLFESKVESNVTTIPLIKGSINKTTTGSVTTGLQKGIMIGSVSVPLGDYVHSSRLGLGSAGRRITTPLPVHQSYTAALVTPPVQHPREPMTNTIGRQKIHDGINNLEFKDSSNVQVMDSFGDLVHYKISSLRSTPCMNLNLRHMRGPTYPLGDRGERGILLKQPSLSSGPIRHLPQKVWRPVRSTCENANPNLVGGNGIESRPLNAIEKEIGDPAQIDNNIDLASSQAIDKQVWDMDIGRVEQRPAPTTNSRVQIGDQNCILVAKNEKEKAPQNVAKCDASSVLNSEHLQIYQETSEVASMTKVDNGSTRQHIKNIVMEQNMNCIVHDKKDNTEKMDDKVHLETIPSHSAWIAEAVEFHLKRWQSGLKDPETVVGTCEEEHPELQTSKWIDFLNNLPSIAIKLSFQKEDARDSMLRAHDGNDQIGSKSYRNLLNELKSKNARNSRSEGSIPDSQAVISGEELQDPSFACESGSPSDVCSTPVGPVLGSQSYGKCDNEGPIGSRCGSSCSDSSMSSNSRTEKKDWTCTVNATCERPQEKRYMPKQGCLEEKKSC